ncbi:MAG: hypothetical protein ACQERG_01710 [Pseudomonadota bacterium]
MHLAGTVLVWLSILLIVVGMVVGFGGMLAGAGDEWVRLIVLVPWGFLLLMTGTAMAQLSGRR